MCSLNHTNQALFGWQGCPGYMGVGGGLDGKPQNITPCCIALAAVGTIFRKLRYRSNYAVASAADPYQAATAADPMAHCAFKWRP